MNQPIIEHIEKLRGFEKQFFDLAINMFEPGKTFLYPLDILANAVMNRAVALTDGFCVQIENENFICAAPLVRLQLDNLLRFYASFIVDDPHDFALKVFKGYEVRKLKDSSGKNMTDKYLVDCLSKEYSWIENVYRETSGYIHLSNRHILDSSQLTDIDNAIIQFAISKKDTYITDDMRSESIQIMIKTLDILYEFLFGWTMTKRNPELLE